MAQQSKIEWTEKTWNPVTGCDKTGPGCDHCYAERFAERFRGVPKHPYEVGFDLTLRPERLAQPLQWRAPTIIFVNSMSDLFHKDIPRSYIDRVFDTMEKADWHVFQVLTKRSSLMRDYVNARYTGKTAPEHIWLGVSVENKQALSRVQHLRDTNATIRFISAEPLLEDIAEINLDQIHWLIVGGESGAGARSMKPEWALNLRDRCRASDTEMFFKQWGAYGEDGKRRSKKANGRLLEGRLWDEMPTLPNTKLRQGVASKQNRRAKTNRKTATRS